ncbi:MAG TPA: hypothetical protein GXZ67_02800 [Clostridiaceae bacterium]|nr:hypothetical protein [Clostridiaceae bacterium]
MGMDKAIECAIIIESKYNIPIHMKSGKLYKINKNNSQNLCNPTNLTLPQNKFQKKREKRLIFVLPAYTGVAEPRFRRVVSHPSGKSEPALRAMSQGRCECVSLKLS